MNTTESIDTAAVETLVTAIRNSLVWKAFEEANQRFETDPELQRLMDHYRELSESAFKVRRRGEQLSPYDMADIQKTQEAIQDSDSFAKRQAALERLAVAFRAVNVALSDQLGLDFARLAAPPGGSCCG